MVQLRKLDKMIAGRRKIAKLRDELLADLPELTIPYEPEDCVHSYYLYTLLVPKAWAGEKRNRLLKLLHDEYQVNAIVANPPAHSTIPFLSKHTGNPSLPVSEETAARLFCVPIHPRMSEEDNEYLCAALWEAVEKIRAEG
jgi:perosamine synthetase